MVILSFEMLTSELKNSELKICALESFIPPGEDFLLEKNRLLILKEKLIKFGQKVYSAVNLNNKEASSEYLAEGRVVINDIVKAKTLLATSLKRVVLGSKKKKINLLKINKSDFKKASVNFFIDINCGK
jgi:hypothetical protein